MLLAYNLYKEDVNRIFSQAAGIETYHNFTLLHDDLMDKADMRRNKPTVHKNGMRIRLSFPGCNADSCLSVHDEGMSA